MNCNVVTGKQHTFWNKDLFSVRYGFYSCFILRPFTVHPPPLPTPTGPFHWIATPPLDEVSWLFPSEEKIESTITAPPEIAHFSHIPKKVSKDQRYWHSHPTRKLIHWCEVGGGGGGGIKWNDTLTISSMYAILSLLIIWIDYKPFPRPSARITRN